MQILLKPFEVEQFIQTVQSMTQLEYLLSRAALAGKG